MISPIFYAALALVSADLAGDLAAVSSNAAGLEAAVNGWSSDDGLAGALVIQQSYDPLSKAVDDLSGSASGVSSSDIENNVEGIQGLASSVVALLEALTNKADDFQAVGASDIVKNDINGLSEPAAQIVSDLVEGAGDDIPQELADAGNDLSSAFNEAISVFGANPVDFPSLSAGSGSDSKPSASESEHDDSKPSASESEHDDAPASTEGAPSAEKPVEAPTSTDVAPANGAPAVAGAGALFAGVAALLI